MIIFYDAWNEPNSYCIFEIKSQTKNEKTVLDSVFRALDIIFSISSVRSLRLSDKWYTGNQVGRISKQ